MLINQIERYELHAHARGFSSSTIVHVKRCLSFFTKFMGGIGDITDITADDLRHFIVALKGKTAWENLAQGTGNSLSPATINTYVRAVKSFWSWLEREGIIKKNPLASVQTPKKGKTIPRVYSEDELKAAYCEAPVSYTITLRYRTLMIV